MAVPRPCASPAPRHPRYANIAGSSPPRRRHHRGGGLNPDSQRSTLAARDPQTRLRHLQRLSVELANARTSEAAVAATVDHGIGVFGADRAVVALVDESQQWFQMAALNGYPDELLTQWMRFPNDGSSPLSAALQSG